MLSLTRKAGERVVIGGIVVEVLEVVGERVRLGVQAPAETPVRRGESYHETRLVEVGTGLVVK